MLDADPRFSNGRPWRPSARRASWRAPRSTRWTAWDPSGACAAAERVCDRLALLSARGARARPPARARSRVCWNSRSASPVCSWRRPRTRRTRRASRGSRAWRRGCCRWRVSRRAIPPPRYRRISPTRSARSDSPPRSGVRRRGTSGGTARSGAPAGARDAREAPQAAARPGALGRGAVQPAAPERRRARLRLRGARGVFQRGGCRGTRPRRHDERNVLGSREPTTTWRETECGNRRRQKNAGARGGKHRKRVLPAPPLAALRSSARSRPRPRTSRVGSRSPRSWRTRRGRARVGDALAGAFTEKLRFASPASWRARRRRPPSTSARLRGGVR